jgi:hypothetical protein
MAAAIGEEVQKYLQTKFGEWSQRTPQVVQADVKKMVAEVEAQVEDFQLELELIASLFTGTVPARDEIRTEGSAANLLHVPLSIGDISGMTGAIMDPGDWMDVVGRVAQQAVIIFVVGTLLTGNLLIALVLVEAVHLGLQEGEIKKRIRQGLGEKLHENLQRQVTEKQAFIYQAIEQKFTQFATSMTHAIQTQIDELRAEQERIIGQKSDTGFSVSEEKRRLDAVGETLQKLFGELREATPATP